MRKNPSKDIAKPNRAKIKELRDMMKDISGVRSGMTLRGDYLPDDEREDWPDIDADGNLIPDF